MSVIIPGHPLSDETKKAILEHFEEYINRPGCRIVFSRPAIRTTQPGDEWETYKPSDTSYMLLAVGPIRQPLENTVGELLAGDAAFKAPPMFPPKKR